MKVLIISRLDTHINGGEMRLNHVVEAMLQRGWTVALLTSQPGQARSDEQRVSCPAEQFRRIRFVPLLRRIYHLAGRSRERRDCAASTTVNPFPPLTARLPILPPTGATGFVSLLSFLIPAVVLGMRFILRANPDVIYGHEVFGATAGWLLSALSGIPLVTRFHGTAIGPVWKSREHAVRQLLLMYPEHVIGLSRRSKLAVMTNDGTFGDEVLEALGHTRNRILFLMNDAPVDYGCKPIFPKKDLCADLALPEHLAVAPWVLVVSRLEAWKRVERAITAFAEVTRKITEAILIIVGSGTLLHRLKGLCRSLDIHDRVFFLGHRDHDSVMQIMRASECLVSAYDCSNLCNPVLEAVSVGLPIVSIDDGSTSRILKDGVNALLVPVGDLLEDLPNAIIAILSDAALRFRLQSNLSITRSLLLTREKRMSIELTAIEEVASHGK